MSVRRQPVVAAFTWTALAACSAGCAVSSQSWTDIAYGSVLRFRSPVPLERGAGQGVDTDVATWTGEGLRVLIDHGLFADPVTPSAGMPDRRVFEERVDGRDARIAVETTAQGGRRVSIHFPNLGPRPDGRADRLTMTVESDGAVDEATLLAIVRSITFT